MDNSAVLEGLKLLKDAGLGYELKKKKKRLFCGICSSFDCADLLGNSGGFVGSVVHEQTLTGAKDETAGGEKVLEGVLIQAVNL